MRKTRRERRERGKTKEEEEEKYSVAARLSDGIVKKHDTALEIERETHGHNTQRAGKCHTHR